MKCLLFSLPLPLLLAFTFLASPNASEDRDVIILETGMEVSLADATSLSALFEKCDAESTLGGTCNANCSGGCSCKSGLFKCRCTCEGEDDPTSFQMTLPPAENWDKILEIVSSEETELAATLYQDIERLREYGHQAELEQFDALAEQLDERLMDLQSETIERIVAAFMG